MSHLTETVDKASCSCCEQLIDTTQEYASVSWSIEKEIPEKQLPPGSVPPGIEVDGVIEVSQSVGLLLLCIACSPTYNSGFKLVAGKPAAKIPSPPRPLEVTRLDLACVLGCTVSEVHDLIEQRSFDGYELNKMRSSFGHGFNPYTL